MYPEGSLAQFLTEKWLPAIRSTIRPSTFSGYENQVRNQVVPRLGRIRLEDVGPAELNSFYAELLACGRLDGKTGLSPATVRRVHAMLHRAFRDAVRWGLLYENPADRCDPPRDRTGPESMRTWSPNELASFLIYAETDDLYPLWLLIAMTGMRRGEALGLRWPDINLETGEAAVRQTVVWVAGEVLMSTPKTAKGRRVVALDRRTVEVLRDLKDEARDDGGLVFAKDDGEPLDPNLVTRAFRDLVRLSGLPRIRLHDLRHTHATLALQAGIHPKIVSERLGHSNIAFTLDVYSHAVPHMQTEAAERLSDLVFRKDGHQR
ncbi:MAG: tyrosine-type recombinase/integrase [Chloroflexi bacterium]|nr:tyrosine-type recombinase/integrase [Chloroflexota bacterium]